MTVALTGVAAYGLGSMPLAFVLGAKVCFLIYTGVLYLRCNKLLQWVNLLWASCTCLAKTHYILHMVGASGR
jgi:hypothetical protein